MKLFKLSVGDVERLAVANDKQEMFERRAEVEPSFDYLPVEIEEVTVPGHEIHATSTDDLSLSEKGETVIKYAQSIAGLVGLGEYELIGGLMEVEGQPAGEVGNETICAYAMKDGEAISHFYVRGSIFEQLSAKEVGIMAVSFLSGDIQKQSDSEHSENAELDNQSANADEPLDDVTREELKAYLDEHEIEYVPQWGDKRLRELVEQHRQT